jgi:hypothetical protein
MPINKQIVEDQIAITDRAFLYISLVNMPSPVSAMENQQLKTIEWITKQLEDICQLYDGQLALLSSDSFNATFYNTDDDSYPFRALCCAKLASHLFAEQGGMQCDFGLALYRQHDVPGDPGEQVVIEKIAQLARQNQGQLVAGPDFIAHHSIQGRVETQAINPAAIAIMALKEPYESLLERQLKTLKIQQKLQAD